MNKTLVFKLGLAIATVAVILVGSATVSAKAVPLGNCPTLACPGNMSGYTFVRDCERPVGPGCTESCDVFRSPAGSQCATACQWF